MVPKLRSSDDAYQCSVSVLSAQYHKVDPSLVQIRQDRGSSHMDKMWLFDANLDLRNYFSSSQLRRMKQICSILPRKDNELRLRRFPALSEFPHSNVFFGISAQKRASSEYPCLDSRVLKIYFLTRTKTLRSFFIL